MSGAALAVLAKAPRPGRVKTRLCPPCTLEQASWLAAAALHDTLDAVLAVPAGRHVLVLDGDPAGWQRPRLEVVPQVAGGLGARLAGAFAHVDGPCLLIGMDTPQIGPEELATALAPVGQERTAVLGMASDGGFWGIGLPGPDGAAFHGVPMSTDRTGAAQHERLRARGYRVERLAEHRDVDRWPDALAVAVSAPGRFASAVAAVARSLEGVSC